MSENKKNLPEKFDYNSFIQAFFTYGEKEGIVSSTMYTDISDEALEGISSASAENNVANEEVSKRKKEKKLQELDLTDINNYIRKYLETSDTANN